MRRHIPFRLRNTMWVKPMASEADLMKDLSECQATNDVSACMHMRGYFVEGTRNLAQYLGK